MTKNIIICLSLTIFLFSCNDKTGSREDDNAKVEEKEIIAEVENKLDAVSKNSENGLGIPKAGKYQYEIAFAEWGGKSLGDKVELIIEGYKVKVIYVEGNISGLKKGDIIDEGFILKHKSGQWIVSTEKSSVNLDEIGGCTGGPAIIDFITKKYVMC